MSIPDWIARNPHVPGGLVLPGLAALGLCLGSFLNVVIYRLPRRISLWRPRSHCPCCGNPIAARDNIPLLSFLLLRGRCRRCRAAIGIRYPAVELLGGVGVLLAAAFSAGPATAAVRAAFLLAMVAIAFIDSEHRIIPDAITLPGIVLGLAASPLLGVSRLDAGFGAISGVALLGLLALAYRRVRGISGMGGGDIKMAGMVGAFLGWQGALLTVLIGSLLGTLWGATLLFRGRATSRTALPFGTFLAPAAGIAALVGPEIWGWYLGL